MKILGERGRDKACGLGVESLHGRDDGAKNCHAFLECAQFPAVDNLGNVCDIFDHETPPGIGRHHHKLMARKRASRVDLYWLSRRRLLMKVKDVMHRGVEWVGPQTTITEIARKMLDEDIGSVPVGENDRLVGMVTVCVIVPGGLVGLKNSLPPVEKSVMTKP